MEPPLKAAVRIIACAGLAMLEKHGFVTVPTF